MGKEPLVPTKQQAGWAPEPVQTLWRSKISLDPTKHWTPHHPAWSLVTILILPSCYIKLQRLCHIWSTHSGNWRLPSSMEWLWRILLPPLKMKPHPTKQVPSILHSQNYKWTVNLIWKLCTIITSSAHASVYIIYITYTHPRQIYCSTLHKYRQKLHTTLQMHARMHTPTTCFYMWSEWSEAFMSTIWNKVFSGD